MHPEDSVKEARLPVLPSQCRPSQSGEPHENKLDRQIQHCNRFIETHFSRKEIRERSYLISLLVATVRSCARSFRERRLVMRRPAAVEMLKSWQQAEMNNNIVEVCRDGASTNNKTQGMFSAFLLVNTLYLTSENISPVSC